MGGGGGGSESSMKTKSWCSNCRRVSSILMSTPPSYSSSCSSSSASLWRGGNSLLKIAMTLAMVVLLFSIYQSCAPHESSLPVWLSLSFVSRPSFILSSHELSQEPQERPASRLVEALPPIPLDFSTLPPGDVSPLSTGEEIDPSDGQSGDEKTEKRDHFDAHNGSSSGLQRASGSTNSGSSSAAEKDLPQDPVQITLHGSSTSDVGSSPPGTDMLVDPVEDILPGFNSSGLSSASYVGQDESQSEGTSLEINSNSSHSSSSSSVEKGQSQTMIVAETPFMGSAKNDQPKEGKILEEGGKEIQQLEVLLSSNSSRETKPEADKVVPTEEVQHHAASDYVLSSHSSRETKPEADRLVPSEEDQHHAVSDYVLSSNSSRETKPEADRLVPSEEVQHHAASDYVTAATPGLPVAVLELPEAANIESSVDTHLSEIAENAMDDPRVKLEQQLHAARQAIEGATLADSDPSLYRVIYHNISAFSKSYQLMEEMFKIYVYKDGTPPLVHVGPLLGIYASEGKFLDQISRGSPFIVEDPELAHMYFLPYSVTQMTLTIYVEGSHSMHPLNTFIKDYVNLLAAKYPFWNRKHGADHFFVSCHDWGPATARDHEELRKNAMKVVCNADVKEDFVLGKDGSLPEIYLHDYKPVKVGGPGAVRRKFLAFFAGQMHGHVRPVLLEHWKDKDPDMKIYEVLPKRVERIMNYVEHMKNSKYCICAAGYEVNSPRIVESIYYDCVPVVIADNFVLPFSDVLNWSAFSVTIPESEIPNLKSILMSISDRQYKAMQKRLSKVRQHFIWHDQPVKYDAFHMIMHSVWMSRLNRLNL